MTTSRTTVLAIGLALAALSARPAAAQPCILIDEGLVVEMAGASSDYEQMRGDRRVRLGIFSELLGGDRVRLQPQARLAVQRPDGSVYAIPPGAERCVRKAGPATPISNVLRAWGEKATRVQDRIVGDLTSRGPGGALAAASAIEDGALRMMPADTAGNETRVAAGERRLTLAWRGGKAPFHLTVTGPAGAAVVDEKGLTKRMFVTKTTRVIAPGAYKMSVRDKDGQTVSGGFVGIEDPALVEDGVDGALVRAASLLAAGRRLDALMVLFPYRGQSETALALIETLIEDGQPRD